MASKDEKHTWQHRDLDIQGWGKLVGFRILANGDFLIVYEPGGGGQHGLYTARSRDEGKTWSVTMANLALSPFIHISGKDNNLIKLWDRTLVVAVQLWGDRDQFGGKASEGEEAGPAYALRSTDGGMTWPNTREAIAGLVGEHREPDAARRRESRAPVCLLRGARKESTLEWVCSGRIEGRHESRRRQDLAEPSLRSFSHLPTGG